MGSTATSYYETSGLSSSTTATSNANGTPTASLEAINIPEVGATSTNTPQYAYLSHIVGEALQDIEKALVELGYDNVQDGNFIDSLEQFKEVVGLLAYST